MIYCLQISGEQSGKLRDQVFNNYSQTQSRIPEDLPRKIPCIGLSSRTLRPICRVAIKLPASGIRSTHHTQRSAKERTESQICFMLPNNKLGLDGPGRTHRGDVHSPQRNLTILKTQYVPAAKRKASNVCCNVKAMDDFAKLMTETCVRSST